MIGRLCGMAVAVLLTILTLAGIALLVAFDMLGEELLLRAWRTVNTPPAPKVAVSGLESAKDITFFTSVPATGHRFEVTTGVRFANTSAMQASQPSRRWCYVAIGPRGGFPRQVELATQSGTGPPSYKTLTAYPASELAELGISASSLEALARTHCRFTPDARVSLATGARP